MSERKPVLGIAFVLSEPIQAEGLQVLKVYRRPNGYALGEGIELVISALNETLSHLGTNDHTLLFLAVDIVPTTSKRKRRRRGV